MATVMPDGNIHPSLSTDLSRAPRATLPTMYDLPSEDPEEPGLPDEFHIYQPQLLRETFQPSTYPPEQVFVASDLNLYYSLDHTTWYKRPDWFGSLGVSRLYEGHELRLSYVVWQEQVPPYLVVELLSPGKEQEDLGRTVQEAGEPPTKWMVYEQILRVPYYVVFNRYTDDLHYFQWLQGRYREVKPPGQRLWLPEAGLGLGLWQGVYQGVERRWLRFYDAAGHWIPTPLERENQQVQQERQRADQERQWADQERQRADQERQRADQERQRADQERQRADQEHQHARQEQQRADQERQRADQERQRAERLAARLRALGIELDE
ncbi:MAG: Uma2 family endonuclease [Candidatus Competibacteraceae bacterium]